MKKIVMFLVFALFSFSSYAQSNSEKKCLAFNELYQRIDLMGGQVESKVLSGPIGELIEVVWKVADIKMPIPADIKSVVIVWFNDRDRVDFFPVTNGEICGVVLLTNLQWLEIVSYLV